MNNVDSELIKFPDKSTGRTGSDSLSCDRPLGSFGIIATNYQDIIQLIAYSPKLKPYEYVCTRFAEYLEKTKSKYLSLSGINLKNLERVSEQIRYNHRWKEKYRSWLLARFYQLEDYVRENPVPLTMISLTTYQDGFYSHQVKGREITLYESFDIIQKSRHKLITMITTRIRPGVDYFWVLEPHVTGYPHCHLVLFADLSQPEINKIQNLWVKYGAGSKEHGCEVTISRKEDSIKSIRNYLMKYLAKTFLDGDTGSRYSAGSWGPGEFVFNAIIHEKGYRTWCPSRGLGRVMSIQCEALRPILWDQLTLEDDQDKEYFKIIDPSPVTQFHKKTLAALYFSMLMKTEYRSWSSRYLISKYPNTLKSWIFIPGYFTKWFDRVIELDEQ